MDDIPQDEAQQNTRLFETLKRSGFKGRDAHYTIQTIRDMASANLIHRFESEMHAVRAQLDALGSRFNLLQWMIGVGFVILGILITVLGVLLSQP